MNSAPPEWKALVYAEETQPGGELLEPGMRGIDRDTFVRRLLKEQVSPSELRSPSARTESG